MTSYDEKIGIGFVIIGAFSILLGLTALVLHEAGFSEVQAFKYALPVIIVFIGACYAVGYAATDGAEKVKSRL